MGKPIKVSAMGASALPGGVQERPRTCGGAAASLLLPHGQHLVIRSRAKAAQGDKAGHDQPDSDGNPGIAVEIAHAVRDVFDESRNLNRHGTPSSIRYVERKRRLLSQA